MLDVRLLGQGGGPQVPGLWLVIVGQFLDQLEEQLPGAILGNVGTLIAFRVGDPKILADKFFPEFSMEDLGSLARGHVLLPTHGRRT